MGGEKARSNLDVASRCCVAFVRVFLPVAIKMHKQLLKLGRKSSKTLAGQFMMMGLLKHNIHKLWKQDASMAVTYLGLLFVVNCY